MNLTDQITTDRAAPIQPANLTDRVEIATDHEPPDTRQPSRAILFVAGAATALLLWLCFFPLSLGWLAWAALGPLLILVRSEARLRWILLASWIAGLAFFTPALQWLRVADPRMHATWLGLALYCSLYFPAAVALLRFLDRRTRLPLIVTVPVVWTASEYVRAYLMTGFPWYFLAHTQHDFPALIQMADLTGAYGVSFVVAAVNALLFSWLYSWGPFRDRCGLRDGALSWRALIVQTGVVIVLLAGVLGYGCWRLGQDDFTDGPRVALVQTNLPQQIRNAAAGDDSADPCLRIVDHVSRLTDLAVRRLPRPDLIVWPETSYPDAWTEIAPGLPAERVPAARRSAARSSRQLAHDVSRLWPTNVLLGMNSEVLEPDARLRRFNSAILIRPNGKADGRYDKMHRVPFGEYVPLRDWVPWMNTFAPYDFDYSITSGDRFARFALNGHSFGVIICYEDSDPELARQYVRGAERPADFLVNISNDGWFDGTSEHDEHLAICRFRAVECRRTVVRAVNMGISAVIDGNGRVLRPELRERVDGMSAWEATRQPLRLADWAQYKKTAGVLTAVLPIDGRSSLYAQWGDWLPIGCGFVLLGGLVVGWRRPRLC